MGFYLLVMESSVGSDIVIESIPSLSGDYLHCGCKWCILKISISATKR